MLKRLFPTIAQLTSDWPPEQWMLAPLAVVVLVMMVAGVLHAISPSFTHWIVRLIVSRRMPAWSSLALGVRRRHSAPQTAAGWRGSRAARSASSMPSATQR